MHSQHFAFPYSSVGIKELELLTKVKQDKEEIDHQAISLKSTLNREAAAVEGLLGRFEEVKEIVKDIKYDKTKKYL